MATLPGPSRLSRCLIGICAAAMILAGTLSVANAVPIVVNGDFETSPPAAYGAIPGWTQDPYPLVAFPGGPFFGYLSGANAYGIPGEFWDNGFVPGSGTMGRVAFIETFTGAATLALKQTVIGFEVGKLYELSYYENSRNNTNDPTAETFVGGVSVIASHLVAPVDAFNTANNPFVLRTAQFIATATSLEILFRATQNNGNDTTLLLDNVSVTLIPEPASLGLLVLGSVGLLSVARRSKCEKQ